MWIIVERAVLALTAIALGKQVFNRSRVDKNRLYSEAETAKLLKVDKDAVRELIKESQLRAKKIKDMYFITGSELERFLS